MQRNKKRDRLVLLGVPVVTLVVVIVAVLAFGGGGGGKNEQPLAKPNRVASMLDGIPQDKLALGSPKAPVTLVEFADLQCPYCGHWARNTLPELIRKYVRPGKVRIEFRGLHFIGGDSTAALRVVLAAGLQNKLWQMTENLYEAQGTENSGWVNDELIRRIGARVPGLDTKKMLADAQSDDVTKEMDATTQLASSIGVDSTPTFFAGLKGEQLARVDIRSLDPSGIEPTLDELVARSS